MPPALHLKTETDPVSKTFCFKKYWTVDKVQKLSNPNKTHNLCQYFYYKLRSHVATAGNTFFNCLLMNNFHINFLMTADHKTTHKFHMVKLVVAGLSSRAD